MLSGLTVVTGLVIFGATVLLLSFGASRSSWAFLSRRGHPFVGGLGSRLYIVFFFITLLHDSQSERVLFVTCV
jgi:hypothetical protein